MPNEPLEQLGEDSETSRYEDVSEPAVPDEEAGYKRTKNPKLEVNSEASAASKFDVVEGRKKFIAFLCVSCITLYSYGVDSLIKLFWGDQLSYCLWFDAQWITWDKRNIPPGTYMTIYLFIIWVFGLTTGKDRTECSLPTRRQFFHHVYYFLECITNLLIFNSCCC